MENRKMYILSGIIIVLAAVALILYASTSTHAASLSAYDNAIAPPSILSALHVSESVSSQVGIGSAGNFPARKNASILLADGKPEVLYIGAEYCPYCATERWPMIIALMRFGNFTGLRLMTSSSSDAFPSTPTFTFYNSTYSSNYVTFVSVETTTNKLVNGTYPTLQTPNNSQGKVFSTFDVPTQNCPNGGCIPFISYANRSVQIGVNYDPTLLQNMNWSQIARSLSNSSSAQAQGIVGSANLITAEICSIDNNTPSSVCSQPYVAAIQKEI